MEKNVEITKYLEHCFDFKGVWEQPSTCGLKIVKNEDAHIIIATELYLNNPGTSVTNCNQILALFICQEFNLNPQKVFFIEHSPDRGSHMAIYSETFHHITFDWNGKEFSNPKWEGISKERVDKLISSPATTDN